MVGEYFGNPIVLAILIPLAGALVISRLGRWPNLRETATLVTAGALFIDVLWITELFDRGHGNSVKLWELFPGLGFAFEAEPLGLIFALIASGLWIVTSVYAIGYMRGHHEVNQTRFYVCFAIALSSAMGIAFAGNMLTLFIFYEVLTLSTYPLVTHAGNAEAKAGGRIYLGILLFTSIVFLLTAVIWTWAVAGTLDFSAGGILDGKVSPGIASALLILYAFGVGKAALMPFHRWLPAAMVAPAPVSALLHAVAVVKAGVFTVLKVAVYIFGIDFLANVGSSRWLMYLAAATILIASLVAMRQDNLKRRLAYSTVSQLSYIVLAAMLATPLAVVGGAMHIAMHAFGKITLFFCAGAIDVALHKKDISDMRGIGRAMPFTMGAFLIASLSIIGLPPLGGLWSKWYLGLGALQADEVAMVAVLMISSLLNVAYLLPIPVRAFFEKPANGETFEGLKEAPLPSLLALCFTALGCALLFFFPEPLYRMAQAILGN
jgi:multicomponent Na+:H+ antiporter subunit D